MTLGVALAASGCGSETDERETSPVGWQRGASLTAFGPLTLETPAARAALFDLQRVGASNVALVPTWYMETASSSTVAPLPERTPRDVGIRDAAEAAQSLGLEVTVKPHVDVLDGTFRGEIDPASIGEWFASYERLLVHYADLAEEVGATLLVIGTEFATLSEHEGRFRDLIATAREHFSGALTYAANWVDEAEQLGFWDELDYVGVDAYMPLATESAEPSVSELELAWKPYVDRLAALHDRTGLPVLLTELGYQSRIGSTQQPYGGATGAASEEAQERPYEAAFRVFAGVDWFAGIYWWDWPVDEDPAAAPRSYSPRGKPAEATLRRWHRLLQGRGEPAAGS